MYRQTLDISIPFHVDWAGYRIYFGEVDNTVETAAMRQDATPSRQAVK